LARLPSHLSSPPGSYDVPHVKENCGFVQHSYSSNHPSCIEANRFQEGCCSRLPHLKIPQNSRKKPPVYRVSETRYAWPDRIGLRDH